MAKAIVPMQLKRPLRPIWWSLTDKPVYHQGVILPSRQLRAEMCDWRYQDNEFFLGSAIRHAQQLKDSFELTRETTVIDVGCGLGRLPLGLAAAAPPLRYVGLDSYERFVWWCRKYIQTKHPHFEFIHLDVENERYNPNGKKIAPGFRFPVPDATADAVYLWGVLTNMAPDHMEIYVAEIARILRKGGRAFLSAFVERDVPAVAINPTGYVSYPCIGPLHVVRYERNYLGSVFDRHSLALRAFEHQVIDEKQSTIQLEKQ